MTEQTNLSVGLHVFPAERAYENPTGQYPHEGVGRLMLAIAFKDLSYSDSIAPTPLRSIKSPRSAFS